MYQNAHSTQCSVEPAASQPQTQRYHVTHDFDGTATLSETLIHAVSGAANVDVSKVEQTLARQLDPTALDRIFRPVEQPPAQPFSKISITVFGHDVTVHDNGQIIISPRLAHQQR